MKPLVMTPWPERTSVIEFTQDHTPFHKGERVGYGDSEGEVGTAQRTPGLLAVCLLEDHGFSRAGEVVWFERARAISLVATEIADPIGWSIEVRRDPRPEPVR